MKSLLLFSALFVGAISYSQSQPNQPPIGPAGTNYAHAGYDSTFYGVDMSDRYWLFEPNSPTPDSVPTVVMLHGKSIQDTMNVIDAYMGLVRHLVRKGYNVICPTYQCCGELTAEPTFTMNTSAAIAAALSEIATGPHVKTKEWPGGKEMIGIVGHSRGGHMTFDVANNFGSTGLPEFDAVASFMGSAGHTDMVNISPTTNVLLVKAEEDLYEDVTLGGMDSTWDYYIDHVLCTNKSYLEVKSDDYGTPDLVADHYFFFNSPELGLEDAIDYFATYKLVTSLMNCTFWGTQCAFWHDDPDSVEFMGEWDDNEPITPIEIVECVQLGIDDESWFDQVSIYPNPFQNQLSIDLPTVPMQGAKIQIFNAVGQKIHEQSLMDLHNLIGLSNCEEGFFTYRLEVDGQLQTGKLIKR